MQQKERKKEEEKSQYFYPVTSWSYAVVEPDVYCSRGGVYIKIFFLHNLYSNKYQLQQT